MKPGAQEPRCAPWARSALGKTHLALLYLVGSTDSTSQLVPAHLSPVLAQRSVPGKARAFFGTLLRPGPASSHFGNRRVHRYITLARRLRYQLHSVGRGRIVPEHRLSSAVSRSQANTTLLTQG